MIANYIGNCRYRYLRVSCECTYNMMFVLTGRHEKAVKILTHKIYGNIWKHQTLNDTDEYSVVYFPYYLDGCKHLYKNIESYKETKIIRYHIHVCLLDTKTRIKTTRHKIICIAITIDKHTNKAIVHTCLDQFRETCEHSTRTDTIEYKYTQIKTRDNLLIYKIEPISVLLKYPIFEHLNLHITIYEYN